MNQLYIYIWPLIFVFSSHLGQHRALSLVARVIQWSSLYFSKAIFTTSASMTAWQHSCYSFPASFADFSSFSSPNIGKSHRLPLYVLNSPSWVFEWNQPSQHNSTSGLKAGLVEEDTGSCTHSVPSPIYLSGPLSAILTFTVLLILWAPCSGSQKSKRL